MTECGLLQVLTEIGHYSLLSFWSMWPPAALWQKQKAKQESLASTRKILSDALEASFSIDSSPFLSIVVPSYNEEANLKKTMLSALRPLLKNDTNRGKLEMIVSDGGSTDKTKDITAEVANTFPDCSIRFISGGKCRADCQNAGASEARGSVLLFLHADTILPSGYFDYVQTLMSDSRNCLGAFGFDVDNPNLPGAFVLRWLVDIRSTLFSLPYGDQALFIRRNVFAALGGFPSVPLMEDYDFVQQLRSLKVGKIILVPFSEGSNFESRRSLRVITSSRRWEIHGVLWTTVVNQLIIIGRSIGVPHSRLSQWYYGLSSRRMY